MYISIRNRQYTNESHDLEKVNKKITQTLFAFCFWESYWVSDTEVEVRYHLGKTMKMSFILMGGLSGDIFEEKRRLLWPGSNHSGARHLRLGEPTLSFLSLISSTGRSHLPSVSVCFHHKVHFFQLHWLSEPMSPSFWISLLPLDTHFFHPHRLLVISFHLNLLNLKLLG